MQNDHYEMPEKLRRIIEPPKTQQARTRVIILALRAEAVREVLELLARSTTDREAGRKALLLAFLFEPELIGTQRELARRMGVTEGRASQMLKSLKRNLAGKSDIISPRN